MLISYYFVRISSVVLHSFNIYALIRIVMSDGVQLFPHLSNIDSFFCCCFFFCLFFLGGGGGLDHEGERGNKYNVPLLAGHHRSVSETPSPNIECWLGSFVLFQGILTSIAKKPYILVIFMGGPDPLFPLWIREC